jgi:hypothetical protein
MKTKIMTILIFILVFTWITLCYNQGWAFRSSTTDPLQIVDKERLFTCTNQGPAADKTVEVLVNYKIYNGKSEPEKVSAEDKTDTKTPLKALRVKQPYFFMREKNPTNPEEPQIRVGKSVNTGPPHGSIICTKNNYPVFVWGNQAWFIDEEKK